MTAILIADDSALVRQALRTALEAADLVVVAVDDYDAAVAALARRPFDAAVLDLELADRSGVSLAAHIRQHHPSCRVAFFTGSVDETALGSAVLFGPVFRKGSLLRETVAWAAGAGEGVSETTRAVEREP